MNVKCFFIIIYLFTIPKGCSDYRVCMHILAILYYDRDCHLIIVNLPPKSHTGENNLTFGV